MVGVGSAGFLEVAGRTGWPGPGLPGTPAGARAGRPRTKEAGPGRRGAARAGRRCRCRCRGGGRRCRGRGRRGRERRRGRGRCGRRRRCGGVDQLSYDLLPQLRGQVGGHPARRRHQGAAHPLHTARAVAPYEDVEQGPEVGGPVRVPDERGDGPREEGGRPLPHLGGRRIVRFTARGPEVEVVPQDFGAERAGGRAVPGPPPIGIGQLVEDEVAGDAGQLVGAQQGEQVGVGKVPQPCGQPIGLRGVDALVHLQLLPQTAAFPGVLLLPVRGGVRGPPVLVRCRGAPVRVRGRGTPVLVRGRRGRGLAVLVRGRRCRGRAVLVRRRGPPVRLRGRDTPVVLTASVAAALRPVLRTAPVPPVRLLAPGEGRARGRGLPGVPQHAAQGLAPLLGAHTGPGTQLSSQMRHPRGVARPGEHVRDQFLRRRRLDVPLGGRAQPDAGRRAGARRLGRPLGHAGQQQRMGVHRVVRGVAPRRLDPVAEHREQPQIEQGGGVPARPAGQFVLPREEREPPRGVPEQLGHRHRQRLLDRGESGGHRVQLVLRRRPQPVRVRRRQLPGRGLGDGGVAPGAAAEPQAQPGRQQFRVADHRVAGAAGPAAPVQGGPPLEEDGRSAPGDDPDAARAGRRAGVRHPEQRAQLTAEGVRALGRAGVRDRRHARTGTARLPSQRKTTWSSRPAPSARFGRADRGAGSPRRAWSPGSARSPRSSRSLRRLRSLRSSRSRCRPRSPCSSRSARPPRSSRSPRSVRSQRRPRSPCSSRSPRSSRPVRPLPSPRSLSGCPSRASFTALPFPRRMMRRPRAPR